MKIFIRIGIFIFLCLLISFIAVESFIIIEGNKLYEEKADYLFILGAKLYGDVPSPSLLERLKVGLKYLNTYKDVKVVVTGGKGSDELITEAKAMKTYLVKNGINESRIIVEEKSTNTFQNIKFGLEKVKEIDDSDEIEIVIATNRFHVFRSKFIANRLHMTAYGLPAKVPPTTILKSYIREYFAVIQTFLVDR